MASKEKAIIVISTLVDSNIKSYLTDTEFYLFRTIDGLSDYINTTPIRAQALYMTREVTGETNTAFTYLYSLVNDNAYLNVDKVYYITEENSPEVESVKFLIDEYRIQNWQLIFGTLTRAYVTEVINGTAQSENLKLKHKAVYRQPRGEYRRAKMREYQSLQQEYQADDQQLSDIPDEELPEIEFREENTILEKIHIIGNKSPERTAFAYLAAQYLSKSERAIIIEHDKEFHQLTEFVTKSGAQVTLITVKEIYDNIEIAIEKIRKAPTRLVVIGCIEKVDYEFSFLVNLVFYNLMFDFRYLILEEDFSEAQHMTPSTVIFPDTVIGCLQMVEKIDKSMLDYLTFVAVDLEYIPQIHLPSSKVLSKILQDLLNVDEVKTTVVKISTLKLGGSAYDLGSVLSHDLVRGY